MRNVRWTWIAIAAFACLIMGIAVSAQNNQGQYYSTAQIEQFVAPVALYPDALLAQVFMASTYPDEVVDASQWTQQNPGLSGDNLAYALDGQNWDVSVKSLVPFPEVLYRMAQNEAWTQDLGNAFLAQPNDVTDAVQRLRRRAYDSGNLRTSSQQRVIMEPRYIQIEPVNPQIVYVPAYNPMVVYGAGWGYPTYYYPAMMQPPPYYAQGNVISFGVGFMVGAALFGAFDWNNHDVYYGPNFYQYGGYRRDVVDWQRRYPGQRPDRHNYWSHDPVHRGPVGYHIPILQQRYGHGYPTRAGHNPPGHNPQPPSRNIQPVPNPRHDTNNPPPMGHNPPTGHNPPMTNHNRPPVTHNPPQATHNPLPAPHNPPATHNRPPVTHNPPPMGHNPPPVTHNRPPVTHNPPQANHNPPPATHNRPPITHNPPPTNHNLPPAGHNPPPAAHNLPPAGHNPPPLKPNENNKDNRNNNKNDK